MGKANALKRTNELLSIDCDLEAPTVPVCPQPDQNKRKLLCVSIIPSDIDESDKHGAEEFGSKGKWMKTFQFFYPKIHKDNTNLGVLFSC